MTQMTSGRLQSCTVQVMSMSSVTRTYLQVLKMRVLLRGKDQWNFKYRAAISRPQEWFNRSWAGQVWKG